MDSCLSRLSYPVGGSGWERGVAGVQGGGEGKGRVKQAGR